MVKLRIVPTEKRDREILELNFNANRKTNIADHMGIMGMQKTN